MHIDTRKQLSETLCDLLLWCTCEEDVSSVEHWIFHTKHSRKQCAICASAVTDVNSLREHTDECAYVATVKRCRGKQLRPWRRASY